MKAMNCPLCGRTLQKIAKKDNRTHKIACCGKWIWFDAETNEYFIKQIPERTSSSGARFY